MAQGKTTRKKIIKKHSFDARLKKVYTIRELFIFHSMITKVIGVKRFRENVTSLWREAHKKNIRYIVMHHSKPILEVNSINEDELMLETVTKDIKKARNQVKKGEIYTHEEVRKKL